MKPKIKIEFNSYGYECGDKCCYNYGTITKVNDVELDTHNQDTETIVEEILKHLGYDVELVSNYDYED